MTRTDVPALVRLSRALRGVKAESAAPPSPAEPPPAAAAPSDAIDFAWKVHAATQDWIKNVDTKSSLTLAITVGFGVFAAGQVFGDKGSLLSAAGPQLWAVRFMGAAFLATGVLVMSAVFPQLKRPRAQRVADGLIYFGHLRRRTAADIETVLRDLSQDDIRRELAVQLEVTSRIAWRKHVRLQAAQVTLMLAIFAFVLAETLPA